MAVVLQSCSSVQPGTQRSGVRRRPFSWHGVFRLHFQPSALVPNIKRSDSLGGAVISVGNSAMIAQCDEITPAEFGPLASDCVPNRSGQTAPRL